MAFIQERQSAATTNGASTAARVAVLGASGYTGEEVVRLLAQHPTFSVTALTGESNAGKVRKFQLVRQAFQALGSLAGLHLKKVDWTG